MGGEVKGRYVSGFGIGTAFSRLFGLVREMVLAGFFGAGWEMDAFRVGFNLPNLFRDVVGEGALNAVFLPLFGEIYTKEGKESAWHFARVFLTFLVIVVLSIVVLGELGAGWIVRLLAPGMFSTVERGELTVLLLRIDFPFLFFISLSAFALALLTFFRHFFVAGLAPVFFNVGSILGIIVFYPVFSRMGVNPIASAGLGVVVGGLLQFLFQLPWVFRHNSQWFCVFEFNNPNLLLALKRIVPVLMGYAATRINVAVNIFLASLLVEGSISYLQYAYRLMHLPLGVFGVAIATATLPVASVAFSSGDKEGVNLAFLSSLKMVVFLVIPVVAFLLLFAKDVVSLVYERGAFMSVDTLNTAMVLLAYTPAIFGASCAKVLSNLHYSAGDTASPMRVSVIAVVVNILCAVLLMRPLGAVGLALATSISALVNAVLLYRSFSAKVGVGILRGLLWYGLKVGFLSLIHI